jgi:hypothetical protein
LREQRGGLADQRAQMMGELERLRGELEQEREGHLEAVGIALGETREQIIADFERRVAESEQRLMVKFIEHFMRSGLAVKTLAVRGTYDNRERYSVLDGVAREREGAASFQRSRCRHR